MKVIIDSSVWLVLPWIVLCFVPMAIIVWKNGFRGAMDPNSEKPRIVFVFTAVMGAVLIVVGLSLFLSFGKEVLSSLHLRNGIEVPVSEVLDLQMNVEDAGVDVGFRESISVRYLYKHNDVVYTGTKASILPSGVFSSSFQRRLYHKINNFKNGEGSLTCFISRGNPAVSVIDNTAQFFDIAVNVLLNMIVIALGGLFFYLSFKRLKIQKNPRTKN